MDSSKLSDHGTVCSLYMGTTPSKTDHNTCNSYIWDYSVLAGQRKLSCLVASLYEIKEVALRARGGCHHISILVEFIRVA